MRHLIMQVLAIAAAVLGTTPVYADLGDQLFKLVVDDAAVAPVRPVRRDQRNHRNHWCTTK